MDNGADIPMKGDVLNSAEQIKDAEPPVAGPDPVVGADGSSIGRNVVKESELPIKRTWRPPIEVRKQANEYLKDMFLRGQHGRSKEDSIITLDLWDFAGQHLYYASHPVFFSPRGVYVLVHNLSKPLDALAEPRVRQGVHDIVLDNLNGETNMENFLSWLVTVHRSRPTQQELVDNCGNQKPTYLRPPVIIVGTHADKPCEGVDVVKSRIRSTISGKEYEKHVIRPFFSIDNTRGTYQTLLQDSRRSQQSGIVLKSIL